jgi:hypothetical protein
MRIFRLNSLVRSEDHLDLSADSSIVDNHHDADCNNKSMSLVMKKMVMKRVNLGIKTKMLVIADLHDFRGQKIQHI